MSKFIFIIIFYIFIPIKQVFADNCKSLFLDGKIETQILMPVKSKDDNLELSIYLINDSLVVSSRSKSKPSHEDFELVPFKPKFKVKFISTQDGIIFEPDANIQIKSNVFYLHGSGGGSSPTYYRMAYYLASQGHRVTVYNYFDNVHTGLPQNLNKIEINNMAQRLIDLKSQYPGIPLLILGSSRGAELSLILAHLMSWSKMGTTVSGVISDRPFDRIAPAFFPYHNDPINWKNGKPYEHPVEKNWIGSMPGPHQTQHEVAWTWKGQPLETFSPIEIEKIKAPTLVLHGTHDEFWSIKNIKILQTRTEHSQHLQSETLYSQLSNEQFQFHIFKAQKHKFEGWAQKRRFQIILDFIDAIK